MLHLAVDVGGHLYRHLPLRRSGRRYACGEGLIYEGSYRRGFRGHREMDVALGEISLFSHGTAVATNALITREFLRAAMVTTRGFRDVIEIRRHGVILDWGTGELLPKTTEGFRAMLERRVVPHWKNGPQESRGA